MQTHCLNTRSNSSNSHVDTPLGVGGVVLPYEDKISIFSISIVVLQRQNIHMFWHWLPMSPVVPMSPSLPPPSLSHWPLITTYWWSAQSTGDCVAHSVTLITTATFWRIKSQILLTLIATLYLILSISSLWLWTAVNRKSPLTHLSLHCALHLHPAHGQGSSRTLLSESNMAQIWPEANKVRDH